MSYAILNLVYGIPLSWSYEDLLEEENFNNYKYIDSQLKNKNINGLLKYDSKKSSSYSFAFGIEIKKISSYAHHTNLTQEMIEVTKEIEEQFNTLFNGLNNETKKVIKSFGKPRLCLVWSHFSNEKEKDTDDPFYKISYQFKIRVDQ